MVTWARTHEAPATRPVSQERWWTRTYLGPGRILGALGVAGVVLGMLMSWRDPGVHATGIPVSYLWDRTTRSTDPSLLIVLIPIAVVLALGVIAPLGAWLRFAAGLAMLAVTGLFAYQLYVGIGAANGGPGLTDVLGPGFYAAASGAVLAFVSGVIHSAGFLRRPAVITE